MLAEFPPTALGGAFTEFVRISNAPVNPLVIRRHLGPRRFSAPVGLQLMGSEPEHVAASAIIAAEVGAPLVDLNFGCPSRGAIKGCAGSALLGFPDRMEDLIARCVRAVGGKVPVSAKIRAGVSDAKDVEVLARAVENGGASLLTIHCRTRKEAYCEEVDWERIARAVSAVKIPVCGNGSIFHHNDLERMRRETGCTFAMVGRGALGDPWIFTGQIASKLEAARFLLRYVQSMRERAPGAEVGMLGRMKQLLRFWTAGGIAMTDRVDWLRISEASSLIDRLLVLAEEPR
jgi:tRNA-dihydrouridine synthase